jgi:hypothetical protein
VKAPSFGVSKLEQIVELLFGVEKVERVGTYTWLSRVGVVEGKLQVPGNTATE